MIFVKKRLTIKNRPFHVKIVIRDSTGRVIRCFGLLFFVINYVINYERS